MNKIIDLIKAGGAVREFKDIEIPNSILDQIVEAGRWGLSILGMQPWEFVLIKNKTTMLKMSDILNKKADCLAQSASLISRVTSKVIKNSGAIIAIYNTKVLEKRSEKFGQLYVERAYFAEIQAIGGAIQNMVLQTNELGLGCVWLDTVTFCSEEINAVLKNNNELVAFLAIGQPAIGPHRSKRRENNVVKDFK